MNDAIVSIVSALIGVFATHILERSKVKAARAAENAERQARMGAEAKLADIKRRAHAPYFTSYPDGFNGLYIRQNGGVGFLSPGQGNVLCWMRGQVDDQLPDGEMVYHVLNRAGTGCRWIRAYLEGQQVLIAQEADMQSAHGHVYLAYPFQKASMGKVQELKFEFESDTGFPGIHVYALKHGVRMIERIDPPCEV